MILAVQCGRSLRGSDWNMAMDPPHLAGPGSSSAKQVAKNSLTKTPGGDAISALTVLENQGYFAVQLSDRIHV